MEQAFIYSTKINYTNSPNSGREFHSFWATTHFLWDAESIPRRHSGMLRFSLNVQVRMECPDIEHCSCEYLRRHTLCCIAHAWHASQSFSLARSIEIRYLLFHSSVLVAWFSSITDFTQIVCDADDSARKLSSATYFRWNECSHLATTSSKFIPLSNTNASFETDLLSCMCFNSNCSIH